MIGVHRSDAIANSLLRQKERFADHSSWTIGYLLIPVTLVSVLYIYATLEVNKRLYAHSEVLTLKDVEPRESPIWLSIAPENGEIKVTSSEGTSFLIPLDSLEREATELTDYLQSVRESTIKKAVLANKIDRDTTLVTLSVDQSLSYYHVRPVLYSLAKTGLTNYGFEGKVVSQQ